MSRRHRLRAAFMGSPEFAVPYLHVVARRCDLQLVFCQPDKPAGRGRSLKAPAVKEAACKLDVPIIQPTKMKDGAVAAALRDSAIDVAIVVAFGRILPPDVLVAPKYGCINVHGSLLPRWRGAAPIQRAILAGDEETGVCIMAMDEGLDTGAVYVEHRTPIFAHETSGMLFERLAGFGAAALDDFLQAFPDVPPPTPQPEVGVTIAAMLRKEEGKVDFSVPVRQFVDHVRGMDPWPGAFALREGGERLRLFAAQPSARFAEGASETPGTVLTVDEVGLHVAVAEGIVCVREVQPEGKRRMPARAYAAGRPFTVGERFAIDEPVVVSDGPGV